LAGRGIMAAASADMASVGVASAGAVGLVEAALTGLAGAAREEIGEERKT